MGAPPQFARADVEVGVISSRDRRDARQYPLIFADGMTCERAQKHPRIHTIFPRWSLHPDTGPIHKNHGCVANTCTSRRKCLQTRYLAMLATAIIVAFGVTGPALAKPGKPRNQKRLLVAASHEAGQSVQHSQHAHPADEVISRIQPSIGCHLGRIDPPLHSHGISGSARRAEWHSPPPASAWRRRIFASRSRCGNSPSSLRWRGCGRSASRTCPRRSSAGPPARVG